MKALSQKIAKGRRYGTLLSSIRSRLYRTGININPFYLVEERLSESGPPELKDNLEDYRFQFLTPQDMKMIGQSDIVRGQEAEYNACLAKGWKCMGAKYRGKTVAYNWIDLEECHFPGQKFRLKKNEAYLFNMYTAVPFRGKNIAAYLRYETYKALEKMGRDTFYSISEVFNKPSIRFKQKLNARFVKKGLFIEFFKKIRLSIPLKTYKEKT
jgi:hypothetical protein